MFATSTKTATFFPTLTPQKRCVRGPRRDRAACGPGSVPAARSGGSDRGHPALSTRTGFDETVTLQAGPLRRVVRESCLDDAAALVARRPEDLLQQRVRDAVRVMVGIDHDQVHDADEASSPNGWTEGENRSSNHVASGLGNEDARLREIDQLSEQATRVH